MNDTLHAAPGIMKCPGCGWNDLRIFYSVEDVPVHSVVLLHAREEALNFPTGNISLGFCPHCGFVSNLAFDPNLQDYSYEYEATQGYSPTFNQFNRRLAEMLMDRYDLTGKRILEIGCGQGEFLSLLCADGKNTGIGFDPAYDPGRTLGTIPESVQIVPDYYSAKYTDRDVDFICCKMTLEHIHPTLEFVSKMRDSLDDQYEVVVFFQIPNADYVFGDLAFWDVYYEHCSYFTKGSVSSLFALAGFDVLDLWTDYDDQYLMVEARPSRDRTGVIHPPTNTPQDLALQIDKFSELVPRKIHKWVKLFQQYHESGQRVILWGGGSKAVSFLTSLGVGLDLMAYVVDINPNKDGTYIAGTGQEIIQPERIPSVDPHTVIVMNPVYQQEIQAELFRMDLNPHILTIDGV